jgi:hypothetical protein
VIVFRNLFAFEVRRRSCTCRKTKVQKSMRNINLLAVVVLCSNLGSAASAQPYRKTNPIAGQWTYRSFQNSTDLVNGDAAKALALIFREGIFTFDALSPGSLKGTLDMGVGYVLDIEGTVRPDAKAGNYTFVAAGHGRPGTPTAGWEYDYHAELAYTGQMASTRFQRCSAVLFAPKLMMAAQRDLSPHSLQFAVPDAIGRVLAFTRQRHFRLHSRDSGQRRL